VRPTVTTGRATGTTARAAIGKAASRAGRTVAPPLARLVLVVALLAAGTPGALEPGWVHLRGEKVVQLALPRAGQSAAQRAEESSRALQVALEGEPAEALVTTEGETAIIRLGQVPVLTLDAGDAQAAGAASLQDLAAGVASRLDAVVRSERRRSTAAGLVFSVSLLVFAGLLAWLLLRRLLTLEGQLRRWARPGAGARTLTVAGVDVTHAAATPRIRTVFLRVARLLAQVLVIWTWVLFALSLFPQSRPWAEALLGALLDPVVGLAGSFVRTVPGLVAVAVVALLALAAIRTLRLVFESAARREATIPLVAPERALALGRISRAAVAVLAILLAAPLVAGGDGNAMGRLGEAALVTLALALVPVAAAVLAGLPWLLGRTLQVGDRAEVAGRTGRVAAFGALGLELEEPGGGLATVPWLVTLIHPVRVLPPLPGEKADLP
jgi:small-conductance mechanosensitive channel